jgi:transcriptional regulator with XRE-family HTH domain
MDIGKRVKQARMNKGFTQQDLADKCGFTKSLMSKIENGQTASAVATLSNIAKYLDVPLSWMLGESSQKQLTIQHQANRVAKIGGNEIGYMFETLAKRSPFSRIEPVVVTVLPDADRSEPFTHSEDEFIYILEGSIDLWYDGETHRLTVGDSAYFDGNNPHIFLAVNGEEAKVLSIFVQAYSA